MMKKTLISLVLILVLRIPIFSIAEQSSPHLANDEELELTVQVMSELQHRMKDPDSFKIFETYFSWDNMTANGISW